MGAVFNAFLEAKLFVEVELERPNVSDLLSRTVQVIGISQIELIEERLLLELRQRKEENISDYARRVGAFKTLALKTFSDEHWASNCFSGLNDECLRDAAKITMIVRELVHQDSLVNQLDVLWAKLQQVQLFDAEAQAHEEESSTDQEHNRVVQSDEGFQNIRLLTNEKKTRGFADREALYSVDNSSFPPRADQTEMEGNRAKTATELRKLDVQRRQQHHGEPHVLDVETVMMSTIILFGNKKALCANTIDGANYGVIPVTKIAQMKRTMSSGASCIVTMTTIVRTS